MKYKCSKCEMLVIVLNGNVIKACKCEAPIVVEIEAVAKGKSKVN